MRHVRVAVLLALCAGPAGAAATAWTGGAVGNWHEPTNWSGASVPGLADDATLTGATAIAYSTNPAVAVNSLTIGAGGAVDLSTAASAAVALTVQSGGAVRVSSAGATVWAGTLTLQTGASVSLSVVPSSSPAHLVLGGDLLDLQAGATIFAAGRGYVGGVLNAGGTGAGGGGPGGAGAGGGGGHAGVGGTGGGGGSSGVVFDTGFAPAEPGAGGGGAATSQGGAGGGFVRIAFSTVNLNGLINADGDSGESVSLQGGGGGAGGAILVKAATLNGTGTLSVRGGTGGTGANFGGGGGGGGRVWTQAAYYASLTFAPALRVTGGFLGGGGTLGGLGSDGTAFLDPRHWSAASGNALASTPSNWSGGFAPSGGERLVFGASDTIKTCQWDLPAVFPSSASLLVAYSSTVMLTAPLSIVQFEMAGGTVSAAANVALTIAGQAAQSGGRVDLSVSTMTLSGVTGAATAYFADASAGLLIVGGVVPSTISLTSNFDLRARAHLFANSVLEFTTGYTLVVSSNGPFSGTGMVRAPIGHRTQASGSFPQTWTSFKGYLGDLKVSNISGGLNLSTSAAGTTFAFDGEVLVDTGAVLRATAAFVSVGGDWEGYGTVFLARSTITFTGSTGTAVIAAGAAFDRLDINAGTNTVALSTEAVIASSVTVQSGVFSLGASTISVRASWTQTGGTVDGGTSRAVFDGASAQLVRQLAPSTFGSFYSSSSVSVLLSSGLAVLGELQLHRGALDISNRGVVLSGPISQAGGIGFFTAGSTVTLVGTSTQNVSVGSLDTVVVQNFNPAGVRLLVNAGWGSLFVRPGATFDPGARALTLTGLNWDTAGANYLAIPQQHTVTWTPPSSVTVAAGSVVNAKLILSAGKTANLLGDLVVGGAGNSLDPKAGATIVNAAGGSTITFRDSADLVASAGGNWTYGGDVAASWLVFEGTGLARGASISSNTFGSVRVAMDTTTDTFRLQNMNLLGSFVVEGGSVRPNTARTLTLAGNLTQTANGVIDFVAAATGTVRFINSVPRTMTLVPSSHTLWNVALEGVGGVDAASDVKIRGDFTVTAGSFSAGSGQISLQRNVDIRPGVTFAGQTSTVTLDGALAGRSFQSVNMAGGGGFHGLSIAVSSAAFLTSSSFDVFTDSVAGSTVAFAAGATFTVGEFRIGASAPPPIRLRSTVGGSPWLLNVLNASTVTLAFVSDSNASGGIPISADDAKSTDGGGNVNWDFSPQLLVLLPGETFTPSVAPGKSGVPFTVAAGSVVPVEVRAISSLFDLAGSASGVVTLGSDDAFAVLTGTQSLSGGAAAFTISPRGAEPSPRQTVVSASAFFATGVSTLPVTPAGLARLVVVLPGQSAEPGSSAGYTGAPSARVSSVAFTATVRAADAYGNLVSTITDTVALGVSAPSSFLPAPQALVGGQLLFTGLKVFGTGFFVLSATDASAPAVASGTSAVFGVSLPSLSSPSAYAFTPDGALLSTLGGALAGTAADGSAIEAVFADLRDIEAGLHFDWNAQSFSSVVPFLASGTLASPLSPATTWSRLIPDAAFVDGHHYLVTLRADNPSGLQAVYTSTFVFDRGVLNFGARDGQGVFSVLPSTAAGCEVITSTLVYTVGPSGLGRGGALAVRVPDGWTLPLGTSGTFPPPLGFWHAASTSLAASVPGSTSAVVASTGLGRVPLGPGWLLLRVADDAAQTYLPGQRISLTYTGQPPLSPSGRGTQSFTALARGDADGVLLALSSAPALSLNAGTTSHLAFTDPSALTLSPLQDSPTMQLTVTDLCGNSKAGLSSGTVTLALSYPSASGPIADSGAAFKDATGATIGSVFLSTGFALSPPFRVMTATSAPADLLIRALVSFQTGLTVEASRPLRLRASAPAFASVSADTGTLAPGATSAALSATAPASSFARVVFTLADPSSAWDLAASTDGVNFSSPAFVAAGYGSASGALAAVWDGVDRVNGWPPRYARPGRYKIRLRAGGGAARDTTTEFQVPVGASYLGRLGATGAGALVRVEGPGAGEGRWAVASSTGFFQVYGLAPGASYRLVASTAIASPSGAVLLSTALVTPAAAAPWTDLGTLSFPATSQLRVAAVISRAAPFETVGAYSLRVPGGAIAASGPLRLSSGAASTDDGGTLFGRAGSTWSAVVLPAGVYDAEISFPELNLSTRVFGLTATAGGRADLRVALDRRAAVSGFVVLSSTRASGVAISVQALRAGATAPFAFSANFASSAPPPVGLSSGAYSLYGLDPGTWTLRASADGFVSTQVPVLVAEGIDQSGLNFVLALGGRVAGGLTVTGDSRGATQCFAGVSGAAGACPAGTYEVEVEALSSAGARATDRVRLGGAVASSSGAFALSGLSTGTWTLRAFLPGFALAPAGGTSVAVTSTGAFASSLTLAAADARLRLTVNLPPLPGGVCRSTTAYRALGVTLVPADGTALAAADVTALAPTATGPRSFVSTTTGAFELLHCSSAVVFSPPFRPGELEASAQFATTGGAARGRALLTDGATAALTLDLTGSTWAVTGTVTLAAPVFLSTRTASGAPSTVAVSSAAGVLAFAPPVPLCLPGLLDPVLAPALRAELTLDDGSSSLPLRRAPSAAPGACAAPAATSSGTAAVAYMAGVTAEGTFSFAGVPAGAYRLRVPGDLDGDATNGDELAEFVELVRVSAAATVVEATLSPGRRVAGRLRLPAGGLATRAFRVRLLDASGSAVRETLASMSAAGSASFTLTTVPDGEYALVVEDQGAPRLWAARPARVTVAQADLSSLDLELSPAATVRARLALARILPGGGEEHALLDARTAYRLPRGFVARAVATPWFDGGAVSARPGPDGSLVDAEGRVVIDGLPPGAYEVEFSAPSDPASLGAGGEAIAPARVSGLTLGPGQAADLGVVPLWTGGWVAGRVTDAGTGAGIPGVRVVARPSLRSPSRLAAEAAPSALTDASGRYLLRGLDPETRWHDLTAAPRGALVQGDVLPAYAAKRRAAVDASSGTIVDFALSPAAGAVTGRVVADDASALFSPEPGALLYLQANGVAPEEDPLSDLSWRTDPDGRFAIPALATGSYRLVATALGRGSLARAVVLSGASADAGTLTLGGGGVLSGSLRLPDGSSPSDSDARAVAAIGAEFTDFVYGEVLRDAAGRAAVGYRIGGLRPARAYRLVLISAGGEVYAPDEAAAAVLASGESRVLDLLVRPPRPTVATRARKQGSRFLVDFLFSRPLRERTVADADFARAASSSSATGAFSVLGLSADRRVLSLSYDPALGESSFTFTAAAPVALADYDAVGAAAMELTASATATLYSGLDGYHRASIPNAIGGALLVEGDPGRVILPRGAFLVDASSSVTVTLLRSPANLGGSRTGTAALPSSLSAAAAALPPEVAPASAFFDILLPPGVPTMLARPATLTLSYTTATVNPAGLNLYWYNPASNSYILQPDAFGGAPVVDPQARTVTTRVNHFSTFVLLDASAGAIGGAVFSGGDIEAYNFPNPFDLQVKTVTTIHGAGSQSVRGTMVRVSLPPGLSGTGTFRVFDATGRKLREISLGGLSGGQTYYQGWDGRNDSGRDVASGLYIGMVEIGGKRKTFKMAVIK